MTAKIVRSFSGALGGLVVLVAAASAQTSSTTDSQKPSSPTKLMTLSGCIGGEKNHYVLSDGTGKSTYRLSGTDVHDYIGQHVQISGAERKRLRVAGGLYPSPNVAAQAGSIDPAVAA